MFPYYFCAIFKYPQLFETLSKQAKQPRHIYTSASKKFSEYYTPETHQEWLLSRSMGIQAIIRTIANEIAKYSNSLIARYLKFITSCPA